MRLAPHIRLFVLCSTAFTASVGAQPARGVGIYTCVDASGQRITADRPIAQCADREQRILGPTGMERSRVGPALTEAEMSQRLEQRRNEQQQQQRAQEQRRRDAILLARYPQRERHDAARRDALVRTQELQVLAQARMADLEHDSRKLQKELDFYGKDSTRLPRHLRVALEDMEAAQQEQRAVLAAQAEETQRVHRRFDAELLRLQPLWRSQAPVPLTAATGQ